MGNKWILDVLTDLRTFAVQNDLPQLATRLEETAALAHLEIASDRHQSQAFVSGGDGANVGRLSGKTGAGERL